MRYRRYTQLPALLHMLARRELTLLDPSLWDDRNDSFFLEQYRDKRKLKSVLALCFTRESETYHHWRVFAPGDAGVRVSFDSARLQPALDAIEGVRIEEVRYLLLKQIEAKDLQVSELPFIKRWPYRPEKEIRILWESSSKRCSTLPIPFNLDAITDITLSPWMHPSVADEVKQVLKLIEGCQGLRVARSTLVGNDDWMERARRAT